MNEEKIIIEPVPAMVKVKFCRELNDIDPEVTIDLKIKALEELEKVGWNIDKLKFTHAVYSYSEQVLSFEINI